MRCLGRTKKLGRCKRHAARFYCHLHRFQPIALLFTGLTALGLLGGIYQDIWRPVLGDEVGAALGEHDVAYLKNELVEAVKSLGPTRPLPTWTGPIGYRGFPDEDPEQGADFNRFMLEHEGEHVELYLLLDENLVGDLMEEPDWFNRWVFTVRNDWKDFWSGGCEYLFHVEDQDSQERPFKFDPKGMVLSGRFHVWLVAGPHQGYMSVNLRPSSQ